MKVNLIFPPLVSPSCIPIGIASLKAYAEAYLPKIEITLIDLSISITNRILEGELRDLNRICKESNVACGRKKDTCPFQGTFPESQKQLFKKAKAILRDNRLFLDKEIFGKFIGDCYGYLSLVDRCLLKIITDYTEHRLDKKNKVAQIFQKEMAQILSNRPDVIGFSVLIDTQLHYSLALAKMVKQRLRIPIVLGGPALFNVDIKELMQAFDFIDFVILKEGELSLVELLKNIKNKKRYGNIPNLVWRKGNRILVNGTKYIANLNELPVPDFDGLELKKYFMPQLILPIATSRGCPWSRCKFCQLNAQYAGPYRQSSVNKVIEQVGVLQKKYGAVNFFFTDSEISSNRLKEISKCIIGRKSKLYFACYARPTKSLDLNTLKTAYQAGCRFFQLGVESFSKRFLEFVDKGTSPHSIREVLNNTHKLKIDNLVYMLACCPSQTKKELFGDFKKIAQLQKKFKIPLVIYCLYSGGQYQRFYQELKKRGFSPKFNDPIFIAAGGKKVHPTDCLDFIYKNRNLYQILNAPGKHRNIGKTEATQIINDYLKKFGLNRENVVFSYTINGFLFETQLLYAKHNTGLPRNSPIRKRILRFYAEKKSDLLYHLYKNGRILVDRNSLFYSQQHRQEN